MAHWDGSAWKPTTLPYELSWHGAHEGNSSLAAGAFPAHDKGWIVGENALNAFILRYIGPQP